MKITQDRLNVQVSASLRPSKYSIAATRESFEILSAGLYSNPFEAIVRELATNAYDAHVAAGKPEVPFEVTLPSFLNPVFSVRDYGTGMSPDDIENLYTIYFASDKQDCDDFVGCLGLGSKSPFAYTDQFTVESRYQGTKYIYTAFKDEEGTPSITLMGQVATDESDGIDIRFPVKENDYETFAKVARKVLSWFTVLPQVNGYAGFTFDKPHYLFETDRFKVTASGESHVIMGNVCYPIVNHELSDLTVSERFLLEYGIDLFVPIGAVRFTPSRESLRYVAKTKDAIGQALTEAREAFARQIVEEIASAASFWEAQCRANKLHVLHNHLPNLQPLEWQGRLVSGRVEIAEYNESVQSGLPVVAFIVCLNRRHTRLEREKTGHYSPKEQPVFVNDLPRGGFARIREYIKLHGPHKQFLCLDDGPGIAEFLSVTGMDAVAIRTSQLPMPAAKARDSSRRSGRRSVKTMLTKWQDSGGAALDHWQPVTVDLVAGGVYVPTLYGLAIWKSYDRLRPYEVRRVLASLDAIGRPMDLYGVLPSQLKRLKKYPWRSLWEVIQEVLTKDQDLINRVSLKYQFVNLSLRGFLTLPAKRFPAGTPIREFLTLLHQAKDICDNDEQVSAYIKLVDYGVSPVSETGRLTELRPIIFERYPLLAYVNFVDDRDFVDAMVDYCRRIDTEVSLEACA